MKNRLLALVLGMLTLPAMAAEYSVAAGSTLGFTGSFQGEGFDGKFDRFEADIRYDPADLASARFEVKVDLASAVTGDSERDSALPEAEFFDATQFPQATFVTSAFRQTGGSVVAEGSLALKGINKPVSLIVVFTPNGSSATLDVNAIVKRLDFNVGTGDYTDTSTIADEVTIKAKLNLVAK
ncbi:MAG: YceI family protein [Dokdonella sp.]